jgi:diguanylate cyclase (GGDEF)-like protein
MQSTTLGLNLDWDVLDRLMPMHLVLDCDWRIRRFGPTLKRLGLASAQKGQFFLDVFEVLQPRSFMQDLDLLPDSGCKFKARFKTGSLGKLKGFSVGLLQDQGILVNFSLGASMVRAVEEQGLVAHDFAPTDSSIDLLYLVEVQQALLAEARRSTSKMHLDRRSAMAKAGTDVLTGLSNLRGMESFSKRIMARKTFVPFGFMMIDLDFFKAVNDTLGHAAGDAVLREVAMRLTSLTRHSDLVARTGGDEFVVILTEFTDANAAVDLATRIISELEKEIIFADKRCKIGASIGVTVVEERTDMTVLADTVDKALYASKQAGRGRATLV